MKNFNIELTYQPINDTWSALIKHGNSTFLELDEDMLVAVEKVTEKFFEVFPPVCRTCGGLGEVTTMEQVYSGEPHIAPIGTQNCPDCNPKSEDFEE